MQTIKTTQGLTAPAFNMLLHTEQYKDRFKMAEEIERRNFARGVKERFNSCGADTKDIHDAGFEKWINPENNEADNKLVYYSRCFIEKMLKGECKNFVLYGESGKSKTYTALSILKEWTRKEMLSDDPRFPKAWDCNGKQVTDFGTKLYHTGLYVRSTDIVSLVLNKGKVASSERAKNSDLYLEYEKCELLIIDEIGRLMPNVKKSDEAQVLFQIIDYRINHFLPVVACTNYRDMDTIKAGLGDALFSRLYSWSVFFDCTPCTNFRKPEIQKMLRGRASA